MYKYHVVFYIFIHDTGSLYFLLHPHLILTLFTKCRYVLLDIYMKISQDILCQVYMKISQDPIKGVYQSFDQLWSRVAAAYENGKDASWSKRTKKSIHCRIQTTEKETQKLHACIKQCENIRPSGASNDDIVSIFFS